MYLRAQTFNHGLDQPLLGADTGHRSSTQQTAGKNHRSSSHSRTCYEWLVCPPSECGHRLSTCEERGGLR